MAERNVLIDANLLIHIAPSSKIDPEKRKAAQSTLRPLLKDPNVKLVCTPLIRYEVLRGAQSESERQELERILSQLITIEISKDIGDLAARLYPLKVKAGMNPNKYNLDILHFATAKVLSCEIATDNKKDFDQLEYLYTQFQD